MNLVRRIRGYASVFGEVDRVGDRVRKGAFAGSAKKNIPMFYKHFGGMEIGKWQRIEEDDVGLYVEGEIWLSRCAQLGILKQVEGELALSVGMTLKKANCRNNIDDIKLEKNLGRDISEVELREISILPRGEQICRSAIVF